MSLYKERDAMELDAAGGFYCQHIMAMTSEQLHSKSDIAAELGYRDMVVAGLLVALQYLVEIYDNDGSRLYTTETKQRALDKAKVAINKALGD